MFSLVRAEYSAGNQACEHKRIHHKIITITPTSILITVLLILDLNNGRYFINEATSPLREIRMGLNAGYRLLYPLNCFRFNLKIHQLQ